jgi:Pentapeptide repeats (8 copies)
VATLRRIPSAAKSPWFWPLVPVAAVAAVGQWVSETAAIEVAAGCLTAGFGVAVGFAVAGTRAGNAPDAAKSTGPSSSDTAPAEKEGAPSPGNSAKTVDLRGARLINTTLVRADLRQADLRGATMTGADLTDADLTGARLGPLDDCPHATDQP